MVGLCVFLDSTVGFSSGDELDGTDCAWTVFFKRIHELIE